MKTKTKFAIISTVLVALVTSVILYQRLTFLSKRVVDHMKEQGAKHIQSIASTSLRPEDFRPQDPTEREQRFLNFWNKVQSPQIVRMKVWDKNFTIIWSNLPGLIGQRFPDNHEVEEALEGEVEFEIEKQKHEHLSERQYGELAELYVPFTAGGGEILGVIEVYQPTTTLKEEIARQFNRFVLITILAALSVLFVGGTALALSQRQSKITEPRP